MDVEQLKLNPQELFNHALQERIKHNSEQVKTWREYKERHEKVIEGLQLFPQELSLNCMVPIGKKALMRGKLTHTNEITVCLGDGYFAKYSAPQAIALCNRRIKKADEMLEQLDKERILFEGRKVIPDTFDIFGGDGREDLIEECDDRELENWRVEHRKREKDYKRKLAELKNVEPREIVSEDDLFKKLDALELQEELEDELDRLEEERAEFYGKSLDDTQYMDESEVDSESYSSDYSEEATNEILEKKSSKVNHRLQVLNSVNSCVKNHCDFNYLERNEKINASTMEKIQSTESKVSQTTSIGGVSSNNEQIFIKKRKLNEKKVAFAEPQVKYFSNDDKIESSTERRRFSVIEQRLYEYSKEDDESEDESDEDETIRIYFKHSDKESNLLNENSNEFTSPKDIYTKIPGPKSILKKTADFIYNKQLQQSTSNSVTEEESNEDTDPVSAYKSIVKDIQEHLPESTGNVNESKQKRPVSKFKLERRLKK